MAVGNRHPDVEAAKKGGHHAFYLDLTSSSTVEETLDTARKELLGEEGSFNVVIYNGEFAIQSLICLVRYSLIALRRANAAYDVAAIRAEKPGVPVSLDLATFKTAMETELNSFYAAVLFAVRGFDKLPTGTPRVFIAGGNACPWIPAYSQFMTLGVGKVSSRFCRKSGGTLTCWLHHSRPKSILLSTSPCTRALKHPDNNSM